MSALKFYLLKVTLFLFLLKFYLSSASVTQEACPPGTAFNSLRRLCYNCSNGYYQDKSGQVNCLMCPEGHHCPYPRTRPIPCPPGAASYDYVYQRMSCGNCSNGYYQDKSGQVNCLMCPEGHRCPYPRTRPIPCPPGTASYDYVYRGMSCGNCSNGYYQDKPGQANCLKCPEGHSCPIPKTRPIQCPPGTASYDNVYLRTTCAECSSGSYQNKPGQHYCIECPPGMYCPPPRNRAIPCPAGTINAHNINLIVDCTACQNGYYQAKIGQAKCLLCPEGHECPASRKSAIPCPPGYWSSSSMYTSQLVKCMDCATGYYQNQAEQSSCIACPDGYSCPVKASAPVACPPGSTSNYYVSQRTHCQRCSGSLCSSVISAPLVCPAGKYFDRPKKSCQSCKLGTYQVLSGQSSCLICPEGFYCPNTTEKPAPCPAGTYSTKDMVAKTSCITCASGTYQTQQGQNLCLDCPAGNFCPRPNLEPLPCPAGSYSSSKTTNKSRCYPCKTNEYQDQTGQASCKPCPPGYFCPSPELSPQQCPPNTYSYDTLTDRSKCLPCSLRQYQDQCGQSQCKTLFPSGTSPTPQPNCRSLSSIATIDTGNSSVKHISNQTEDKASREAYSDAPLEIMEGNSGVRYSVVKILDKHISTGETVSDNRMLLSTAIAFDKMAAAAKKEGVTILIRSGFRTMERQNYLYNCFLSKKCNSGNLAARPGCSRHGMGAALDLNTNCGKQTVRQPPAACHSSAVYTWLKINGHKFGFVRTVFTETWHWEFQGGPINGPSNFT